MFAIDLTGFRAGATRPIAKTKGQAMTILEKVRQFVERLAAVPICDACAAQKLDAATTEEIQLSLNELASERGFDRGNGACGFCGERRPVTRKRA
jgi:hypothetical protein